MLKNKAVRALSEAETQAAMRDWPDRFMTTRCTYTKKDDPTTEEGWKAKARWIIKGFTDPDLLELDTFSPTLSREGFLMVLQMVASCGHVLEMGDVEQAFTNGEPMQRKNGPVFVRQPEFGLPGGARRPRYPAGQDRVRSGGRSARVARLLLQGGA